MRKLIEMSQEYLIVCDNKECDYKIENTTKDPYVDTISYINAPCPKCGENLLTVEDYLSVRKMTRIVNWVNKWFSWTTIFTSKKSEIQEVTVHCHKGIKINNV